MKSLESIFHTEEWLRMLNITQNYKIYEVSTLPLALVKSKIFGNRLISIPFSDYGGPSSSITKKMIEDVSELTNRLNVDFTEIRTPLFGTLKGLEQRNDYCSFVLDLKKDPWPGLEKKVRNGINKSKRDGVEIVKSDNTKIFYDLYVSTVMRLGSPPQAKKFFDVMSDELKDKMEMFFARYNGEDVASAIFLKHKKDSYFSYSCSHKNYSSVRGNDALLWHAIDKFRNEGFERFHFGRTRPNSGVYKYKKSWGGNEIQMPYFYIFNKKTLEKRQEVTYSKISEIWKKTMPTVVAKRIGPKIIKQIG